jgi:hypothetical protein
MAEIAWPVTKAEKSIFLIEKIDCLRTHSPPFVNCKVHVNRCNRPSVLSM